MHRRANPGAGTERAVSRTKQFFGQTLELNFRAKDSSQNLSLKDNEEFTSSNEMKCPKYGNFHEILGGVSQKGTLNLREWTMQEWTMRHHCGRDGQCRSGVK